MRSHICLWSICPAVTLLVAVLGLTANVGCAGLTANLIHAIYGHDVSPEFKGLKKQRIAIVCSNEKGHMTDEVTTSIEVALRRAISNEQKKVSFVEVDEMKRWLEDTSAEGDIVKHVGKGTSADIVIAINIKNMKLRDGKTLYRGVSDIDVDVYDVVGEKYVFSKQYPAFTYPQNAAIGTTEMDETRFQRMYLTMATERISRLFITSPMGADVAIDSRLLEFQ